MKNPLETLYADGRLAEVSLEAAVVYTFLFVEAEVEANRLDKKQYLKCTEIASKTTAGSMAIAMAKDSLKIRKALEELAKCGWIESRISQSNETHVIANIINGSIVYLINTTEKVARETITTPEVRQSITKSPPPTLPPTKIPPPDPKPKRVRKAAITVSEYEDDVEPEDREVVGDKQINHAVNKHFREKFEEVFGRPPYGPMERKQMVHGKRIYDMCGGNFTATFEYLDFAIDNWKAIRRRFKLDGMPLPTTLQQVWIRDLIEQAMEEGFATGNQSSHRDSDAAGETSGW